ncbi:MULTISPECIES: hypothetical protein [Nostocaceae]|uniref:hypothetical protein n=1 Tax=Nostocaceae TaxID=1162 RepID=UPI0037C0EBE2
MKTMFLRKSFVLLPGLVTFAVLSWGFSANAQIVDKANTQQLTDASITATPVLTPIPGTVATSSTALIPQPVEPTTQPSNVPEIAQSDVVNVGRRTRGGRSYIGVGANIGLSGGETSLGDGNFAVLSKVGFTNAFSIRPSAIFGDNTTILIPVTYDFSLQQDEFTEPLPIAPYVGVGAAINTGDNSQVAFLVSGGIDVPLNAQFTATASVNAGFFDQTDVGLLVGVGYNFNGF